MSPLWLGPGLGDLGNYAVGKKILPEGPQLTERKGLLSAFFLQDKFNFR